MSMRTRLARLFTIKTRAEALLVTYAIAVGAIERGLHYMDQYGGYSGLLLAAACLGVPFIAGAKLIDSVKPVAAPAAREVSRPLRHKPRKISRSRPRLDRPRRGSALRSLRRTD